jgi:hypothetical protein
MSTETTATLGPILRDVFAAVRRGNPAITATEAAAIARQGTYPDGSIEPPERVMANALQQIADKTIRWTGLWGGSKGAW